MIGSHRDQAHFDRARWRKRILAPCWTVQISILLALMSVFLYRLWATLNTFREKKDGSKIPLVEVVWECVNVLSAIVSLIINLVQIGKFVAEALTPFGMIFGNVLSLTLSLAILGLDVVVHVQHVDKIYSVVALSLTGTLLLFTIMPIIYGIVVFRRIATVDDYHHPHNAKHYGFSQDTGSLYDPSRMSLNADPAAMYDPADTAVDRPRRPSLTFKRTATDDSSKRSSVSSQPRPSEERRSSYDHKRDTQYDEYVARRKSSGEEDRQSLPSRSRGNSLTQPASWELNLGDATTVPGGSVQRGHSLVSVPEAVEADVETAHTSRNQTPPIGEDWQGMLNGQRTPSTGASSYVSRDSRLGSSQGWQEDELHFQKTRRYS